jgi:hypothetical protein
MAKNADRIKLIIIKNMGNTRGCMLSPTIIGGEISSCNAAQITAREKTEINPGTKYNCIIKN